MRRHVKRERISTHATDEHGFVANGGGRPNSFEADVRDDAPSIQPFDI